MILVVTLNLAIDYALEVDGMREGGVFRASSSRRAAGGKGVNVARVLRSLGEPCVVAGLAGGAAGRRIASGLRAEGIPAALTRIAGESRTCVIVNDPTRREQTVINEPGPPVTERELDRFRARYRGLARSADVVVLTGSLPASVAPDVYGELARGARRAVVDCTGASLRAALAERPEWVKVNGEEAAAVADGDAPLDALARLGARNALVTLGADGGEMLAGGAVYRARPPRVEARNAVGSGDAAAAGLAAGLARGYAPGDLLKLAVAAGAANALHGFGECSLDEIHAIARETTVAPTSGQKNRPDEPGE